MVVTEHTNQTAGSRVVCMTVLKVLGSSTQPYWLQIQPWNNGLAVLNVAVAIQLAAPHAILLSIWLALLLAAPHAALLATLLTLVPNG